MFQGCSLRYLGFLFKVGEVSDLFEGLFPKFASEASFGIIQVQTVKSLDFRGSVLQDLCVWFLGIYLQDVKSLKSLRACDPTLESHVFRGL